MSSKPVLTPALAEEIARSTALAAACQASEALAELVRYARDGADLHSPFGDVEVVLKLADAMKLAMEIEGSATAVHRSIYSMLESFLEGWAG